MQHTESDKKLPNSFLFFHWIVAETEKKIIAMVPKYGGKIYRNKKKILYRLRNLITFKNFFGITYCNFFKTFMIKCLPYSSFDNL